MFTTDFTPVKGLCGVFTDIVSKLINSTEKNTHTQSLVSSKTHKKSSKNTNYESLKVSHSHPVSYTHLTLPTKIGV